LSLSYKARLLSGKFQTIPINMRMIVLCSMDDSWRAGADIARGGFSVAGG